MRTTDIGNQAERAVAELLKKRGCDIVDRNWKTKVCEIDIVAKKSQIVYFVEVKFRSGQAQGEGLDYIGPQKLNRLHFAANVWLQNHNYEGDYRLVAASVSTDGRQMLVDKIIELV